jgi:hypothetical protein
VVSAFGTSPRLILRVFFLLFQDTIDSKFTCTCDDRITSNVKEKLVKNMNEDFTSLGISTN